MAETAGDSLGCSFRENGDPHMESARSMLQADRSEHDGNKGETCLSLATRRIMRLGKSVRFGR